MLEQLRTKFASRRAADCGEPHRTPAWWEAKRSFSKLFARQSVRRKLAVAALGFVVIAFYLNYGFSFRELIIVSVASVLGFVFFSGEWGVRYGFVLWVLTLGLGYRTIGVTAELRIHPSEVLLWVLLVSICAHRNLQIGSRLTFPLWLWLMMPFWVLAWWPLILGKAEWDQMLNEFRNFVLLIPLMIVTTVVLRQAQNWRRLLLALFATATWIAVMGILEFWVSGIASLFPAMITTTSAGVIEGFERAMFSFWGGPMATFICALALPIGIVALRWWPANWQRALIIGSSVAQMIAIYIAGYRSIWVIMICEIVLACLLSLKRQRVTVAAACLVVIMGGYQFAPQAASHRALTGIDALRGHATDSSAKDRISRAESAFNEMIAAPLGNGWSTAGWVHSDFLQVGANLGLLAGLIFLGGYLFTLVRLIRRALSEPRGEGQGDLGVSLLLAYISAGGILATQGVEVLPQLVLPVWFVWVLVEVWLTKPVAAADSRSVSAAEMVAETRVARHWWPSPATGPEVARN